MGWIGFLKKRIISSAPLETRAGGYEEAFKEEIERVIQSGRRPGSSFLDQGAAAGAMLLYPPSSGPEYDAAADEIFAVFGETKEPQQSAPKKASVPFARPRHM